MPSAFKTKPIYCCAALLYLSFCCVVVAHAQTIQAKTYTTADGLPSNSVYRVVQDQHNFLWIATENGLARYDGHRFKVYTTLQGLTANEIINLFFDTKGELWALPFRKGPCRYNPTADRFETTENDPLVARFAKARTLWGNTLRHGNIAIINGANEVIVFDNDAKKYIRPSRNQHAIKGVIDLSDSSYLLIGGDTVLLYQNNQFTRLQAVPWTSLGELVMIDSTLILSLTNQLYRYTVLGKAGLRLEASTTLPFEIRHLSYTGKSWLVISKTGIGYALDGSTLQPTEIWFANAAARNAVDDNFGNRWVSTSQGLVKLKKPNLMDYPDMPGLQLPLTQVVRYPRHLVVANNQGEVWVYDGLYGLKRLALTPEKNMDGLVRRLVKTPKGLFVSCQTGSFLVDTLHWRITKRFEGRWPSAAKDACLLGGDTMLWGNFAKAYQYDLATLRAVDSVDIRVTALGAGKNGSAYVGSTDGLYRWQNKQLVFMGESIPALRFGVKTITTTQDGLLWVGMGTDTVVVLAQNRLAAKLPLGQLIPAYVCNGLHSPTAGSMWVATNAGLLCYTYVWKGGKFTYTARAVTQADGLKSLQVKDVHVFADTVYAATDDGINYFATNLQLAQNNAAPRITRIAINGRDTLLQGEYQLPHTANALLIEVSAVDLSGYRAAISYQINKGNWQSLDGINLELRLQPGRYAISFRTQLRNGAFSNSNTTVVVTVAKPWWQQVWVWLFGAFLAMGGFIYAITYRQKQAYWRKQQRQKAIEEERARIFADLHDDFGSALSTLQLYGTLAGTLMQSQPEKAKLMLEKVTEQSAALSGNLGDIIWSMKPQNDQFVDLESRIKNVVYDILGATAIHYTVAIDQGVNQLLLNPLAKKNLMLMVKEAVNNCAKYSAARNFELSLTITDALELRMADDGIGFDSSKTPSTGGNGLKNMAKRVAELGGTSTLSSSPDNGTTITIHLPLVTIRGDALD